MILFLDFDGVMHPDPCPVKARLFEQVPHLTATLAAFPEVRIVLSTAWRNLVTMDQARGCLGKQLAARICGSTPNFGTFSARPELTPYHRHAECIQWLQANVGRTVPWLALDDRASWFAPYCENLIACNPRVGFDAEIAGRLASALVTARLRAARMRRDAAEKARAPSATRRGNTPQRAAELLPKTDSAYG